VFLVNTTTSVNLVRGRKFDFVSIGYQEGEKEGKEEERGEKEKR
jgi:hypothetical protein